MSLAELWWRSRLRHWLRRRIRVPRRRPAGAFDDEDDAPQRTAFKGSALAQRAGAIAVGTLLALLGGELVLRVPGLPIPRDLSTYLFQCYGPSYEPARILFPSEPLYINLHKPNFDARCGWNGYAWRHQTDAWGGRNPETWSQAEIAMLGDSMTYGHGVDEQQTAAHFLRQRLGVRVTNLGVMGDSFPQYLARLRNLALPSNPRVVFVVVFGGNDLSDIIQVRSEQAQREFIEHGTGLETQILPRDALLTRLRPGSTSLASAIEHHALVYRTVRFLLLKRERKAVPPRPHAPDVSESTQSPVGLPVPDLSQAERLAVEYLESALSMMRDSARGAGSELVVVYLPGLSRPDAREDRLVFHHTRAAAEKLGVRFLDATSVQFSGGHPVPGVRLHYDHHLSEAGHQKLAGLLADYVEENALLRAPRAK